MGAWNRLSRRGRWALMVLAVGLFGVVVAQERWKSLAEDGIHDPTNHGINILQQPAEALAGLPPDHAGNMVSWVQALDRGLINPRTNINPGTTVNVRTTQVLLKRTGEMPMVLFPHRQHTLWLDCSNCHDRLFEKVAGKSNNNMFLILQGEKCGLCHGAVAFPLTECLRCHSVPRGTPEAEAFGKELVLPGS